MAEAAETLPHRFPVFPLNGALLLPSGNLPLNIFEPRYLAMVRDAMRTDRIIGMVQPLERRPELSAALVDRETGELLSAPAHLSDSDIAGGTYRVPDAAATADPLDDDSDVPF